MKALTFYISIALLRFLAILPRPILYGISEILNFFLQHIFQYRKKIVTNNLQNSFPSWSKKEIRKCRRKFYRHLSDIFLEDAVIQFYPQRKLEKMFLFKNPELINKYLKENRHIFVTTGHYNNWEWGNAVAYTFEGNNLGIYKPLRNEYFDKALIKARTRFGGEVVPMANIAKVLFEKDRKGESTLTGVIADQRPLRKQVKYWTDFLNQKTAVLTGMERLAVKFDIVVLYMNVTKVRRGVYLADFELITDKAKETQEYEITDIYTKKLENQINKEPAYWLWSHRRWKVSYETWLKEQQTAGKH